MKKLYFNKLPQEIVGYILSFLDLNLILQLKDKRYFKYIIFYSRNEKLNENSLNYISSIFRNAKITTTINSQNLSTLNLNNVINLSFGKVVPKLINLNFDMLKNLQYVDFSSKEFDQKSVIKIIDSMKTIKSLNLKYQSIEHLPEHSEDKYKNLTYLYTPNTFIENPNNTPNLKFLSTQIIPSLNSSFKNSLRHLELRNCTILDDTIFNHLPNLNTLSLWICQLSRFPKVDNIKNLYLTETTFMTNASTWNYFVNIESLYLVSTNLGIFGINNTFFPKMNCLSIESCDVLQEYNSENKFNIDCQNLIALELRKMEESRLSTLNFMNTESIEYLDFYESGKNIPKDFPNVKHISTDTQRYFVPLHYNIETFNSEKVHKYSNLFIKNIILILASLIFSVMLSYLLTSSSLLYTYVFLPIFLMVKSVFPECFEKSVNNLGLFVYSCSFVCNYEVKNEIYKYFKYIFILVFLYLFIPSFLFINSIKLNLI